MEDFKIGDEVICTRLKFTDNIIFGRIKNIRKTGSLDIEIYDYEYVSIYNDPTYSKGQLKRKDTLNLRYPKAQLFRKKRGKNKGSGIYTYRDPILPYRDTSDYLVKLYDPTMIYTTESYSS